MKKQNKISEVFMCIFLCIVIFSGFIREDVSEVSATVANVVIDAGHGIPDGGAVGKSRVKESEINLKVAQYIRDELKKNGISVIMTREDANALYENENDSIRNKKRADMKKRVDIINGSGASLAVSVHMNYFGIEKYSGPQLFCPTEDREGYMAATQIKNAILKNIGQHCNREIKKVDGGIYLLKNSQIPIVLAECGFLSNEEEEKLLISDGYCKQMGGAIAEGIINYLKTKE